MPQHPKRHHYVPRFILRTFANATGKLTIHNKKLNRSHTTSIENCFVIRHDNTIELSDGTKDYQLEEFYAKVESQFSGIYRTLIEHAIGGRHVRFDQGARMCTIQFMYNFRKRSPDFRKSVLNRFDEERFFEKIRSDPTYLQSYPAEEIDFALSDEGRTKIITRARLITRAKQVGKTISAMKNRGISYATPSSDRKSFAIFSNPTLNYAPQDRSVLVGQSEQWAIIHPKVAIRIGPPEQDGEVLRLPDHQVRKVNLDFFRQSSEVGSSQAPLLLSLAKAR